MKPLFTTSRSRMSHRVRPDVSRMPVGNRPGVFCRIVAGLDRALIGQKVGTRLLVVVPPDDGYGAAGNQAFGLRGTDTLVFVVDLLDAT